MMTNIPQKPKKKYDELISDAEIRDVIRAERPKREYAMEAELPTVQKKVDTQALYVELQALIRDAGGRAPGYMRRLDTIFNKYLV